MMYQGDAAHPPDPAARALARDLEAAVRTAAAEAVARALGEVKSIIAEMDTRDAGERDALAEAAMQLPDKLAPLVEAVVRSTLRDEREALAADAVRGFQALAARIDATIATVREHAREEAQAAPGTDAAPALLERAIDEWRGGLAEALAGALVPHAGALAEVTERVERVDERLGDLETLLRMQGDAIAGLGRKLDARPAGGAPDEEPLARAIEARLRPAIGKEIEAAIAPLAKNAGGGVGDLAMKAMRTHLKAATKAEREHAEKLGTVSRTVEGIGGRLAFAVEALSGHAALIDRLRRASSWQSALAIANFVAALLVFIAVFLDRFWYLLQ